MADYKGLYYSLFNQITEAIELLERTQCAPEAVQALKNIQQKAEERFMNDGEESAEIDHLLKGDDSPKSKIISFHEKTWLS